MIGTVHGPATCRRCSECDGKHHWMPFESYAENEPEHPAAQAGEDVWFDCKHCDAWAEAILDEDGDCECEWESGCSGTGVVHCRGCGGDLCICTCGGESDCFGCDMCSDGDDPAGDDGYDSDYQDQP